LVIKDNTGIEFSQQTYIIAISDVLDPHNALANYKMNHLWSLQWKSWFTTLGVSWNVHLPWHPY